MDKRERLNYIFLFSAFMIMGILAALQLNIPPVLDEVGTLANSAYLVGYDWTETVYTMGGYYYKYGSALLYAPILKLVDNPYMVYKTILTANTFLYAFVPLIAYSILRKHLFRTRTYATLTAVVCAVIPSGFILQLYAKSDSLLIVISWVVLFLLMELNTMDKGKKRTIFSIALAFASVYAYTVHTRGLVIVIATVLTIVLVRILSKKSIVNFPAFLVTMTVLFIADRLIANAFYDHVYGVYGTAHASFESFDFKYLIKIFTAEGIVSVIKLVTGWLFTALVSTFGIVGIAIIGGIVCIVNSIRTKAWKREVIHENDEIKESEQDDECRRKDESEMILLIYAVLSFLGVFAMGILFFFPPAHKYFTGELVERADRLIYERYMVSAFGPVIMLGIYLLTDKVRNKKFYKTMLYVKIFTAVLFAGIIVGFMLKVVDRIEGVDAISRNMIGISTFLNIKNGSTTAVFPNITGSLLTSAAMGAAVFVIVCIASGLVTEKTGKMRTIGTAVTAGTMILFFLIVLLVTFFKVRLSRDKVLVEWTGEPAEILLNLPEDARKFPVFWDASAKDIKHYQFQLKDYKVGSYCTVTSKADNCFVIAKKKHFLKEYYNNDYYCFDSFDYDNANRDMVYVKGEKLAKYLEQNGIKVTEFNGKTKSAELPESIMPYVEVR